MAGNEDLGVRPDGQTAGRDGSAVAAGFGEARRGSHRMGGIQVVLESQGGAVDLAGVGQAVGCATAEPERDQDWSFEVGSSFLVGTRSEGIATRLIFWTRRGERVWFRILTGRRMKAGEWRIRGFSQDMGNTFWGRVMRRESEKILLPSFSCQSLSLFRTSGSRDPLVKK